MKAAPVVKTVRNGALTLPVREYGDGRFGFDYMPPGEERVKVRLRDVDAAIIRARDILGRTQAGKLDLMAIDPDEFVEFLRWKASRRQSVGIPKLVTEFLASKRTKGRSGKHLRDLDGTLTKFAARFPDALDKLLASDVEQWIEAQKIGPKTWNHVLSRIISLHRYARRLGFLGPEKMPVEGIEKKVTRSKRETYSFAQLKALLRVCRERELPYVVGGALCGVRPEELRPDIRSEKPALKWENFLWDKRKIDIPAEVAKDGHRRFVPLCDAALAFFEPWRHATGDCVPKCDVSKITRWLSRNSKVKWQHDALRHSYASYRLAVTKDIAALADEMGNSIKVIRDHYLDRKHDEEGEEWFTIRPENVFADWPVKLATWGSGKVVPFAA